MHFISPYDQVDVMEGQGTCIVEVQQQLEDLRGRDPSGRPDIVVAPIGGGGLMSGVSVASKGLWSDGPPVLVVGTEPSGPCSARLPVPLHGRSSAEASSCRATL